MIFRLGAYKWILSILAVASLIRLVGLSLAPPSLYWEEAALGYDAYSILQTGKDLHGNVLPLVAFPSFGDYKPSLYFYSIIPFLPFFGLTAEAVRMPSALAGIGSIFLLYLIGKRWSEKVGLWAALLYAVQPWSVQISRTGFETNLATFLILLGIWAGWKAVTSWKWSFFSVFSLCLSMYAYHAARIAAPLFGFVLLVYWFRSWKLKTAVFFQRALPIGIISVLLLFPILKSLSSPEVRKRAEETGLFSGTVLAERSNAEITQAGGGLLAKILHHRYLVALSMFSEQYLANFSLRFLFLSGDGNPRHTTGAYGALFGWEVLTVGLGLISWQKKQQSLHFFILIWLLIAAVPAALTTVSPHGLRFLSASPAFALLSGLGIVQLQSFFHRLKFTPHLLVAGVAISATFFVQYGWFQHRILAEREYQYGYKELFQALETEKKPQDSIALSRYQGRPSIYLLFFTKVNPFTIQSADSTAKKDQQELLEVGQYSFTDDFSSPHYSLFATSPTQVPQSARVLHFVRRLDGSVVWTIWRRV